MFLCTVCCIFSTTSAPLANQQIPLISRFGLEHFQNIHPFHPRMLKDVPVAGCTAFLLNLNSFTFSAGIQQWAEEKKWIQPHPNCNSLGEKNSKLELNETLDCDILTLWWIKNCLVADVHLLTITLSTLWGQNNAFFALRILYLKTCIRHIARHAEHWMPLNEWNKGSIMPLGCE